MTEKTESGVGAPDAQRLSDSIINSKRLVTATIELESSWLSFVIATNLPGHCDYAQQATMTKLWSLRLSLISFSD